ncbi:hypothetical protein [Flavobacterium sp.]|uniref:hypothetical protein n=1 Tax=Flavobacterium sp. TaxID=239 RepID=UPI003A8EECAB
MRYIKLLLSGMMLTTVISCNLFSPKNISNDFRWKNKKFDQPYGINLQYIPEVKTELPTSREPWFYNATDSTDTDKKYRVEELLEKKFRKRNIVYSQSAKVILRIDKLLFKEYAEPVQVYDGDMEYIADSTQDFFIFEISASLIKNDSLIQHINLQHHYNNEPRESYVFDGVIVMGGGNASASKMIENSISEFSYRVYQAISEQSENMGK